MYSCSNKAKKEQDRLLREFDSISKSLDKPAFRDSSRGGVGTGNGVGSIGSASEKALLMTILLYDSLEKKFGGTATFSKIQQMSYHMQDFYLYLYDLKRRFYIAAGDSIGRNLPEGKEADLALTNSFFLGKDPDNNVGIKLKNVQAALLLNTKDTSLIEAINKLTSIPVSAQGKQKDFMNAYFYNVPPVAANTILNYYEFTIRNFENQILQDYLNQ